MSQFNFGAIDPDNTDGTELAAILGQWRDALHSSHKGPAAPTYAVEGMGWIDDSTSPWALKLCTAVTPAVAWAVQGYIDPSGPTFILVSHAHAMSDVTDLEAALGALATALDGKLGTTAKAADSDKLDGMQPTASANATTVVQRDASGNAAFNQVTANAFIGLVRYA